MNVKKTKFPGLTIIEPDVFGDNRGWFIESYNQNKFNEYGITFDFKQDNHSFSMLKGTLRGLHFQTGEMAQTKLVRCTRGSLWDICVDLRVGSPTYLDYFGIILSEENKTQFLIPKGFAHGFVTLTDNVEIMYKVDNFYSKEHDCGIRFDDPILNINWNEKLGNIDPVLSEKDLNLSFLNENVYFNFNEEF